jgi:hypothetical protein
MQILERLALAGVAAFLFVPVMAQQMPLVGILTSIPAPRSTARYPASRSEAARELKVCCSST